MSAFRGSRHDRLRGTCPLLRSRLGVKRTWAGALQMSAFDPKRTLSKVRRDFFRSKLLSLVFVLNSTAAAINLHPLDERVVDCNNVCGDGAAVSVHIAEFQSLVTKSIDLPS